MAFLFEGLICGFIGILRWGIRIEQFFSKKFIK